MPIPALFWFDFCAFLSKSAKIGENGRFALSILCDCFLLSVEKAKRQVRGVKPGAIAGRHAPLVEKIIPADAPKCQECACCYFRLLLVCSSKVINRQIN